VYTTLNENELHLPLDEGVTCIPMAAGLSRSFKDHFLQ